MHTSSGKLITQTVERAVADPRLSKQECKPPLKRRQTERVLLADAFGLASRQNSASNGRGQSGRRNWLIETAFVPLILFAGIMILVETKKGRLVIESELAGLNVTLLRDGEFYEELKIQPGTNSTLLFAG